MSHRVPKSFSTSPEMWEEVTTHAHTHGISQSAVVNRALQSFFSTQIKRTSWETVSEDAWYDPKKFYTFSEDQKGHSVMVKIWVPKNLGGQIGRIVNSGMIPELRSPQDFYRDALFHRAKIVAQWLDDGELNNETGMAILKAEEDAIAQQKRDALALIETTRHNLEEAWKDDDFDWIRERISALYEKASSIPEKWRREYLDILDLYAERVNEVKRRRLRPVRGRDEGQEGQEGRATG